MFTFRACHLLCRRIAEREDALGESEADLAARHARLAQAAGSARRELLALRADRVKVGERTTVLGCWVFNESLALHVIQT